jgi:hypothetical protein
MGTVMGTVMDYFATGLAFGKAISGGFFLASSLHENCLILNS